ncbi:MAG: nitrite/sulfite reductase, partial [Pseudomonadota bacterium]
ELLRQWSTDHPEFQFLPRKFKIAVTGSPNDRAVIKAHDIGIQIVARDGQIGYRVVIGGGLGRTPMIGKVISDFVTQEDLLPYIEAIVSVWNQIGRRDNKYKARIKITVHEHGIEEIRARVNDRFEMIRPSFSGVDLTLFDEIKAAFSPPAFRWHDSTAIYETARKTDPIFRAWADTNLAAHQAPGYAIVQISLKSHGATPGDASAAQMRVMADLAERYGHDELRISHEQNVILPHIHKSDLPAIHSELKRHGLATANIGLISDIIACPGMDYCALATARSIPIAQEIATRFDELKLEHDVGPLKIKISGCINACGHHHVGHIGILGLDRAGVENYQITLGGDHTETAAIGDRTGPGFSAGEIIPAIERLVHAYLDLRDGREETFLQTYKRVGMPPFKAALYEQDSAVAAQ